MKQDELPTNRAELLECTAGYAVHIDRPGLTDPFGRPRHEQGFMVSLFPVGQLVRPKWRGYGLTLDEAIENLEEVKPDY